MAPFRGLPHTPGYAGGLDYHIYIIAREGPKGNFFTTWITQLQRRKGLKDRLKSAMIAENSYRLVQDVVTSTSGELLYVY